MEESALGYIPKTLDKSERFLFWDFDQAIVFLLMMGMGVLTGALFIGLGGWGVMAWQYGRLKSGKHPKFALHILYWWMPSDMLVQTRVTPPSYVRYFLG